MKRVYAALGLALVGGLLAGIGAGAMVIDMFWGTGAELEEVYQRGHQNGYGSGYEDGFEEGQNASVHAPTPDVDYAPLQGGLPYTAWFVFLAALCLVLAFVVASAAHLEVQRVGRGDR